MLFAQTPTSKPVADLIILTAEGTVEVFPANGAASAAARPRQLLQAGDGLRTGARSRATVHLSDLTVLRVNELTTVHLQAPDQPGNPSVLEVKSGSTYFLARERPARQQFRTPLTSGAIRGTEFNLAFAESGAAGGPL